MDEPIAEEGLLTEAPTEELVIDHDDDLADKKSKKNRQRIEKHSRLMQYFEDKRLREDLDYIDGW
jgi:hypothetical protein